MQIQLQPKRGKDQRKLKDLSKLPSIGAKTNKKPRSRFVVDFFILFLTVSLQKVGLVIIRLL